MGRDIDRGPELNEAYLARNTWRQKSRAAKRTDYAANRATLARAKWNRNTGYVIAFNFESASLLVEVEILDATQSGTGSNSADTARNLASDYVYTEAQVPTGPPAPNLVKLNNFKPAKIITSTRTSQTGVPQESRVTGLPYLQYPTVSASSPIGRNRTTPAGDFGAVRAAIIANAAYAAFKNGAAGNRISILPEG